MSPSQPNPKRPVRVPSGGAASTRPVSDEDELDFANAPRNGKAAAADSTGKSDKRKAGPVAATPKDDEQDDDISSFLTPLSDLSSDPMGEFLDEPVSVEAKPTQPVASAPVASAPVASAPVASASVASASVASSPVASAPVKSRPAATTVKGKPTVAAPAPTAAAPTAGFVVLPPDDPLCAPPGGLGYEVLPGGKPAASRASAESPRGVPYWAAACAVVIVIALAWILALRNKSDPFSQPIVTAAPNTTTPGQSPPTPPTPATKAAVKPAAKPAPIGAAAGDIELGVAYGTEKRTWLEWAVKEFQNTPEAKGIRVNLIPLGSQEAARAILDGDTKIHVWSPASRLYRESFLRQWERKRQGMPILKEETLAMTPMALVMWKARHDAFLVKAPELSLRTVSQALRAPTGWDAIAGRAEWGLFKFALTDPNQSNSGLVTLVLMAHEFRQRASGLRLADVTEEEFEDYLVRFERGVSGLSNSTGNLMKEMIAKGPSSCDALMVYESVAIDFIQQAEGQWGPIQVVYPKYNLWNDNPYFILNTPWTTPGHQRTAETFLKYLMSEPVQAKALEHGFRPGNPTVPVKGRNSPFTRFAANGLRIELPAVCDLPPPDVIDHLLDVWTRHAVAR